MKPSAEAVIDLFNYYITENNMFLITKEEHDNYINQKKKIKKYDAKEEQLKEYIITHKIYDEVKFKSELLKIIGGGE